VIVQVGLGGDINFPANLLVGKELEWARRLPLP